MDLFLLIILAIVALGLGLAFLTVGYRYFLFLLPVWGFMGGVWLGAEATSMIIGEGFLASVTGLIISIVAGLIIAILSYYFYAIGVLLLGASFGYWLSASLLYAIGIGPGFLVTVVGVVTAIIFATLTVMLDVKKHLLIIMTSFGGAGGVLLAILLLVGTVLPVELQAGASTALGTIIDESAFWLILWLALAIAGIITQEGRNRDYFLEYDRQYGS